MHETMVRLYEAARDLRQITGQSDLARALNASPQTVNNWESRGISKRGMLDAQRVIGVHADWLATGEGPRELAGTLHASQALLSGEGNVRVALPARGRVPVISAVQAGHSTDVVDNFQPGEADEWLEVSCPVRQHTFALVVEGDSMEPEFTAGMRIVVEPEMEPENGDYVVAGNGEQATLKKLVRDGNDLYLKPLNPRYPIKPLGDARIIGVVREAHRKYR